MAEEQAQNLKPATASREDNLTYDLKHMAAFDIAPLNPKTDFLTYTRDSVQLLVNRVFALPQQKTDEGTVAELPAQEVFRLPRTKPIPKPKAKTRWQKFMEEKGMQKRKRSRLVFDEASGDWKPRWGYGSAKKAEEKANSWAHEVKEGDDPFENPFEKKNAEKKLLLARQKMREVRNKVESLGGKLRASTPDLVKGGGKRGKDGLREAMKRAQVSSASMGKFDRKAPNEATNLQPKTKKGVGSYTPKEEKERYLKAATRVFSGEGSVDKNKAAKKGNAAAAAVPRRDKGMKGSKRRSKQGGRRKSKGK
eukprot:TRINITY_DN74174_c0_g1_i1.p1 TRINITY_DN74174_c0_g1~~TRINITY_DN74174_c0_g1_i1.p1  ORF type:complete len:341 (+),score=111.56 TRINITY_DN74174_c0_g1_i1:102-1025(+)